jgi:hypothetical protein
VNRLLASFSAKNRMTLRNIVKSTIAKATAKAARNKTANVKKNGIYRHGAGAEGLLLFKFRW